MNPKPSFPSLLIALLLSTVSCGQTAKPVTDYLGLSAPIAFNNLSYKLSWSSHPSDSYYKQEYLPKTEKADNFKNMILMDVLTGNSNVKDIVAAKIAELKKIKETNPLVNYESFDNPKTGEYMIDFLMSANGSDGQTSVVERNVYRYTTFTTKAGQKGILLFGVSTRSYGNEIDAFLIALKKNKADLVNKVAAFTMPAITIKK